MIFCFCVGQTEVRQSQVIFTTADIMKENLSGSFLHVINSNTSHIRVNNKMLFFFFQKVDDSLDEAFSR